MPPTMMPLAFASMRIAGLFSLARSAAVNGSPGTSFIVIGMVFPGPSFGVAPPSFVNSSFHLRLVSVFGSFGFSSILAETRSGFLSVKRSSENALIRSSILKNAIGVTFRWPMLLSYGTSRHSGIVSPADRLLTLLGSPVAETTMNMHWCPIADGVHLNGPTMISSALLAGTAGADSWGVVIGFQSFG